jgi:hypothetical protein
LFGTGELNALMQEALDPQPTATGKGWMFCPAKLINQILKIYGIMPHNLPDGVTCCTLHDSLLLCNPMETESCLGVVVVVVVIVAGDMRD